MGMNEDLAAMRQLQQEPKTPHPAWVYWNKQLALCVKAKREGGDHRRENDFWFTVLTPDRQKVFEFQEARMEHLLYDISNGIWYTAGGSDARDMEFRDLFLGRLVKWCQEAKQGEAFYYRSNSLIVICGRFRVTDDVQKVERQELQRTQASANFGVLSRPLLAPEPEKVVS
jgi:hypothetical protein